MFNMSNIKRFTENQLSSEFDVAIIGGGINGCGIALDAALRGLKTILLEKIDFGYGCTSASTRLIHGGLRYLENYEFDLVRESLIERESLLKNANHLVKPLEICIPIYKNGKRSYWFIKLGMTLYDLLSYGKSLPSHKMISSSELIKYEPSILDKDLIGGAIYHDAQVSFPERICVELALMAKNCGALVLNHTEVTAINIDLKSIKSIEVIDLLTNKTYTLKAKVLVNASGPWVDSLCGLTERHIKTKIGGTKGSHIVIKKVQDGPKHAIYSSAKSDERPFFIIPWQNNYLIGTTDLSYFDDLNKVKATEDEIKYLLNESNLILKSAHLDKKDIIYSYSGVRPLPFTTELNPSKITRKHIVFDHECEGIDNFISIIGGKLTTYRNLAEQTVNLVYKKLNNNFKKSKTREFKYLGSISSEYSLYIKNQITKAKRKYDLDSEIIVFLIDYYGSRFKNVLDLTIKDPNMGRLLSSYTLDIRAQVQFSMQYELAYSLSDILLRRTTLGLNESMGVSAIPEITKQLREFYNYSDDEIKNQINDYEENILKLRSV